MIKKFLIFNLLCSFALATDCYINKTVASLFITPKKHCCATQLVYGEKVNLLQKGEQFSKVELFDQNKIWIKTEFLIEKTHEPSHRAKVSSIFAHVFSKKSFFSKKLLTLKGS